MPPVRRNGFEKKLVWENFLGPRGLITTQGQNYLWMQQNPG
jgi:hypothetical protein